MNLDLEIKVRFEGINPLLVDYLQSYTNALIFDTTRRERQRQYRLRNKLINQGMTDKALRTYEGIAASMGLKWVKE